jgi:CRP-like cAMP-binding protein
MNSLETNNTSATSELDQNLELLRQTYLFAVVPLESLKVFAYLCAREKFKQGEYLIRQGEDDGQAFYIIAGQAILEREAGGSVQSVREIEAGEFIGGMSLMGSMQRLYSLRAATETTCLILNREKFSRTMSKFQDLMPSFFKALVGQIDAWEKSFLSGRMDQCSDCLKQLGVSLL